MIPPFPEKKCRLITACHSFFLLLCSFFFQPTWNEKNRRTEVMSFRNHELDNAIIHSKVRTVCKRNLRKGGYIKETSKKNSRKTHHVKKLRRLRRITVRWWNRERKIGRRKKNGAKMGGRSLVIQVCARKNVWILSVSKIQRERERERAFVEKKKAKRGIFRWWSPPALVVTKYRVSRPKEDQVLLLGEAQSGVHLLGPPPKSDTDPQKRKRKRKRRRKKEKWWTATAEGRAPAEIGRSGRPSIVSTAFSQRRRRRRRWRRSESKKKRQAKQQQWVGYRECGKDSFEDSTDCWWIDPGLSLFGDSGVTE